MTENVWTIGLDIGQVRDPSVVAEAVPTPIGRTLHASPCDADASVPRGRRSATNAARMSLWTCSGSTTSDASRSARDTPSR